MRKQPCNARYAGYDARSRRTAPCTNEDGKRHRDAHVNEHLGLRWMDFGMELRSSCPLPGCPNPDEQRNGAHFCRGSTAEEFWGALPTRTSAEIEESR